MKIKFKNNWIEKSLVMCLVVIMLFATLPVNIVQVSAEEGALESEVNNDLQIEVNEYGSITYGDENFNLADYVTVKDSSNNEVSDLILKYEVIDEENIGVISETGELEVLGAGTVKIKISAEATDVYESITGIEVEIEILPKTIEITPDSDQGKFYGEEDYNLTYEYDGLVGAEEAAFDGELGRNVGEIIGEYEILMGSLILVDDGDFDASNYNLVITEGVCYSISQLDITETAEVESTPNDNQWYSTGEIVLNAPENFEIGLSIGGEFTSSIIIDTEEGENNEATYYLQSETGAISEVKAFDYNNDQTAPTAEVSQNIDETIWDTILATLTFNRYKNQEIIVTITPEDELSGVSSVEYYKTSKGLTANDKSIIEQLEELNDWTELTGDYEITVDSDERFVIYYRIIDCAGNIAYISSDSMIYDGIIESDDTIEFTTPDNNLDVDNDNDQVTDSYYYKDDVTVGVTVTDPSIDEEYIGSGIQSISYEVKNSGEITQEETEVYIFDGDVSTEANLLNEYSFNIDVDSEKNNSNDIEVVVTVVDNADNSYTKTLKLQIDTTKPKINISYDLNAEDDYENTEGYFVDDRTMTITVTEKNFNADNFAIDVKYKTDINNDFATMQYGSYDSVELYLQDIDNWSQNGDIYTAEVLFLKGATYSVTNISLTDVANNSNNSVTYKDDNDNDCIATNDFTIDIINPTAEVSQDIDETIWDALLTKITFGLYKNNKIVVTISPEDELSGVYSVEYYKTSEGLTANDKSIIEQLEELNDWTELTGDYEITVDSDEWFVVYYRVIDQSGNVVYVSSDGMIYDGTLKSDDTIEFTTPNNNLDVDNDNDQVTDSYYYKDDVTVGVTVTDPSIDEEYIGSGIQSISYEVKNLGVNTLEDGMEVVVYSFEEEFVTKTNIENTFEFELVVDSQKNNSNDVEVVVTVVDNAGNSYTKTLKLKIDITDPEIKVEMTGIYDEEYESYFESDRVATITVTERNFDPDNTVVTIENSEEIIPLISEWEEHSGTEENGDDTTYTATIEFIEDGDYTFDISTIDLAGNDSLDVNGNSIVDYGKSIEPTAFTIDQTEAIIEIEFDNNKVENDKYFDDSRTATITIEEHNFDKNRFEATVNAIYNDGTTADLTWTDWKDEGDFHTTTIVFDQNADYTFTEIQVKDMAGNITTDVSYAKDDVAVYEFTIDYINPIINITYDNNSDFVSGYFDDSRTATIVVSEHNFNSEDFIINVVTENVVDDSAEIPDYASILTDPENWTSDGDTHIAVIEFTESADYTIAVDYFDLANRNDNQEDAEIYGASVTPTEFTIDYLAPTGSITVGDWDSSVDGTLWDKFLHIITFGLWSQTALQVEILSDDEISGIYELAYFRTADEMELEDVKSYTEWIIASDSTTSYTVDPEERFVVYTRITDNAGHVTYVSSDGIIIDTTAPSTESLAPEITINPEQPINEIYNATDTVNVAVEVIDPMIGTENVYSGLAEITYTVTSLGVETQTYTFDFSKESPTQSELCQTYSFDIAVDANLNNSNDVVIEIYAIDNAGNESKESVNIQIDNTLPTINVTYNNNNDDENFEGVFKDSRTATIVITERNFDPTQTVVTIENTDGSSVPVISEWVESIGGGNEDNTTYTAVVTYEQDGDYLFSIVTTDLASNTNNQEDVEIYGSSVAPTEFTIDQTIPTISVIYDYDVATNENYYNKDRTAVITINEHNFETSRTSITVLATKDGEEPVEIQTAVTWNNSGDNRTATIVFTGEDEYLYDFNIEYMDMAGNKAEAYTEAFYVDTVAPEVTISGVEDNSANKGDVIPVVTYLDANVDFTKEAVTIEIVGYKGTTITLDGNDSDWENGTEFTLDLFQGDSTVDDIYTVTVVVTDMAGNVNEESIITFSVNRYGSTYKLSEETEKIVGMFAYEVNALVITEMNVNTLKEYEVILYKDNKSYELVEGEDYEVEMNRLNGEGYSYEYTISEENFIEDGIYDIRINTVDEANNNSKLTYLAVDNDAEDATDGISFGIDKTNPVVVVVNLEDGTTYPVEEMEVIISASDNMKIASAMIILDDQEYYTWTEEEISEIVTSSSNFLFTMEGDDGSSHNMSVVFTDTAGNITEIPITDFYVTTNIFVRYYNNKILFYGSILGVLLLGGVMFIAVKKRKKAK